MTRLVPPTSAASAAESWQAEHLEPELERVESTRVAVVEQGEADVAREQGFATLLEGEVSAATVATDAELEVGSLPSAVPFGQDLMAGLHVPEGFTISVFARDLGDPRTLAVGDARDVYVTRPSRGDVVLLRDSDGDGVMDGQSVVATGLDGVSGMVLRDGEVFLATERSLWRGEVRRDGSFGTLERVFDDLPAGGLAPERALALGPDGSLYVAVGSPCSDCARPSPEHGAILRVAPDLSGREIVASGLGSTLGLAWHPSTGGLWSVDGASDTLRDGGAGTVHTLGQDGPGVPVALAFYDGDAFPAEYRGDAFVAMHGSTGRGGYRLARVDFDDAGRPVAVEPFVSGFLLDDGQRFFGQPASVVVLPDGSVLFSDDAGGVIYRVSWDAATR